jgi:sec-independent protein translocase protein TatA
VWLSWRECCDEQDKTELSATFAPQNQTIMTSTLLFIGNLGGGEWILILLAILLLFGGKKIPELMRGIGTGMREFNDAKSSVKKHIEDGMKEKAKEEGPKQA